MTTDARREAETARQEAMAAGRAWQDGLQALMGGYGEQVRRFAELSQSMWNPRNLDQDQVRETWQRIGESMREVANAQVAVAGEWLRAPFWMTGSASPADLQARYFRLFEANRELATAYLDAVLSWQRQMTGATERVVETAREAVDAQTQTARRVANDVREAQQTGVEAARHAATTTRDAVTRTANQAAEQTREVVNQARAVVERVTEQAERTVRQAAPSVNGRQIKGNVSSRGEKIYHIPGQSSYDRTEGDTFFATEEEAQAAGYRRAQTPGGGSVKGKINRDGERIYHTPGQANYDRVEADMLFASEEEAQAAGFRAAQR